ncbi:MAG: glycerol-3-phosphate acyltransferase [Chloroflexi bacterium]|nr:glycerol-3-phosphate acyltransferase [Chloroflexota bacterium]
MINGILAVVIGYLLGSIPSAYLATRIAKGADIRRLGGGNVGGLNTFREVGLWPAAAVGIVDVGKGAAAVAVALWLLEVSTPFVLLAGLASVVGHNWMVFLKFSGGKGMGATFGALFVLLPVYGYPLGLTFLFGVILVVFIVTRNVALSMGAGLVVLPFIAWFGMRSGIGTIMAVIVGTIILVKFFPTARTALARAGNMKDFIFERGQKRPKEGRVGPGKP